MPCEFVDLGGRQPGDHQRGEHDLVDRQIDGQTCQLVGFHGPARPAEVRCLGQHRAVLPNHRALPRRVARHRPQTKIPNAVGLAPSINASPGYGVIQTEIRFEDASEAAVAKQLQQALSAVPYLATILALLLLSIRHGRAIGAPGSLGSPFVPDR